MMTIPDSTKMTLDIIPMGMMTQAPPVNNACMPDIYNKLDADTIERTRVVNTLLDVRLRLQEKVLGKHQTALVKTYTKERERVKLDLRNIARRLPNYSDVPHLETKILKFKRRRRSKPMQHQCVNTTEPEGIKGIAAEKEDKPFCGRYFSHHLPTKSKWYKDVLTSVNRGMHVSLPDLTPTRKGNRLIKHDIRVVQSDISKCVFPKIHPFDDNFLASKGHLFDDDDDSKTV